MAKKVVVIGGGFAGCGAAAAAARAGAEVTLLEMTDTLTGVGQVSGWFLGGESFVIHEEVKAMGAGDIAEAMDSTIVPQVGLPKGDSGFNRDCRKGPEVVEKALKKLGVKIVYRALASDVEMFGRELRAIKFKDGRALQGDAFVDTTGTCGPQDNCKEFGWGCVGCVLMCPFFGGRISIAAKAGVKEFMGVGMDGMTPGVTSLAVVLIKETLSPELQKELEKKGNIELTTPKQLVETIYRRRLDCRKNRKNREEDRWYTRDAATRMTLRNEGHAVIGRLPYLTREELKQIPGLGNAVYASPALGWIGTAIRHMAMTPADNALKTEGVDNLFVAGEKVGHTAGITNCYVTGAVAGHNAARKAAGKELMELPRTTGIGELIAYTQELNRQDRLSYAAIRAGRLKKRGLYTTDVAKIHDRIEEQGLKGILSHKVG